MIYNKVIDDLIADFVIPVRYIYTVNIGIRTEPVSEIKNPEKIQTRTQNKKKRNNCYKNYTDSFHKNSYSAFSI